MDTTQQSSSRTWITLAVLVIILIALKIQDTHYKQVADQERAEKLLMLSFDDELRSADQDNLPSLSGGESPTGDNEASGSADPSGGLTAGNGSSVGGSGSIAGGGNPAN